MSQDAATDCSSASAGPEPRPRGRSSVFCMLDTLHRVTARPPSGRQTRGQPNAGGDSEVASSEPTREVLITFAGALVTVRPQSGHSTDTSTAPGSSPTVSVLIFCAVPRRQLVRESSSLVITEDSVFRPTPRVCRLGLHCTAGEFYSFRPSLTQLEVTPEHTLCPWRSVAPPRPDNPRRTPNRRV